MPIEHVWVVVGGYNYEGWSEPKGVFDNPNEAYEYRRNIKESDNYYYDYVDVFRVKLGVKGGVVQETPE